MAAPLLAAPQKKKAPPPKPAAAEDPFLHGRPFTLEQIHRAVEAVAKQRIPEARLREAIQNRGLDFSLPAGELDKLKAAGASGPLAELIESQAKPLPKPVEPPKPRVGGLVATCAPAECEVSLNGKAFGTTTGGVLKVGALPAGKLAVDFKKDGFVSIQNMVTIEDGKNASAAVTLEPDRSTKEKWGRQVFQKAMAALGGDAGLQAAAFVLANGSLTVPADGKTVKYGLVARLKLPERGLFIITAGSTKHQYAFQGGQYAGNKALKSVVAQELETDLRLLRDHLLPSLISRLNTPKTKFVADGPAPRGNEEMVFRAEAESEFLDYATKGSSFCPQGIVIQRAGNPPRRAEFRFDSIELSPKLKDTDFVFKKGLFK
ncbi:MAG: hypothetical protein HYR60_32200 [Acidobacteria bacterium]|nr:hypothetical protein [Acidobacteriota bacterium]